MIKTALKKTGKIPTATIAKHIHNRPYSKISEEQKAKIVELLAQCKSYNEIVKETGHSKRTISLVKKQNIELVNQSKQDIIEVKGNFQREILNKTLMRINKNLDDGKFIDDRDLIAQAKEMYNEAQTNEGKASSISTNQSNDQVRAKVARIARVIEQGSTKELAEIIFDD